MKNKHCINIIKTCFLVFFVSVLSSCRTNDKIQTYSCPSKFDANQCSDGCIKEKGGEYSFLVNTSERSVLNVVYMDGEQLGALTYKDCVIFDKLNWDCSKTTDLSDIFISHTVKMTNGVFTKYEKITSTRADPKRISSDEGICAK
jgi:hypothetical protein